MANTVSHIGEIDPDADWGMIPPYMHEGLKRWVEIGLVPGDFMRSVLENDLKGAAGHADNENRYRLYDYAMFMIWYLPAECHGSKQAVLDWVERGEAAREAARS